MWLECAPVGGSSKDNCGSYQQEWPSMTGLGPAHPNDLQSSQTALVKPLVTLELKHKFKQLPCNKIMSSGSISLEDSLVIKGKGTFA